MLRLRAMAGHRTNRIILFLALCVTRHASGQLSSEFSNLSSEHGLPSSECYHIGQDSKGYLWISTSRGVVRYDGRRMKTFTKDQGLTDNVVFSVYEDRKGRIWFRTFNGDLCYYKGDSIYAIGANDAIRTAMKKCIISRLYVDEKDRLLISVYGLTRLITVEPANNYGTIKVEERPEDAGYARLDHDSVRLFSFATLPGPHDLPIHISRSGLTRSIQLQNIHMAAMGNLIALGDSVFALSTTNEVVVIRNNKEMARLDFGVRVIDVFKTDQNSFWISLYKKGIYKYDLHDLSKPVFHFFEGYTVSSVLTDYEGGMWFTTLENGVYYKRNLGNCQYGYPGYEHATLIRFLKTEHGRLFVGTDKPSLVAIGPDMTASFTNKNMVGPGYLVCDIHWHYPYYYLAAYGGLNFYDSLLVYKRTTPTVLEGNLRNACFKQVEFTGDNDYLLTDGYSLYRVHDQTAEKKVGFPVRVTTFQYNHSSGIALVGTKKGLYRVAGGSGPELVHGVPDNAVVTSIQKYGDGCIVATQQTGLFFLKGDKIERFFYRKNFLVNEIITEGSGDIWVATDKGIVYLKKNGSSYKEYFITKSDGLQSDEVSHIAGFNGYIWYSTNSGLYYFKPGQMLKEAALPRVVIEQVLVNNQPNSLAGTLAYWQNNVNVTAKPLSFLPGGQASLNYRLLGYDSVWHSSGGENVINYTNLPAGSYRLEIKGVNAKGTVSADTRTLIFTISTPFWLTWWFIFLEILAGVCIIYVVVKMYVNDIREKERKKAETRRLLSEYQMTALRAQINPHFIFNCISSIQALMLNDKVEKAYEYLQKFSRLLRLVLENSDRNMISLKEELEVINLYIVLEQLRFDGTFRYMETVTVQDELSSIKVPYMILQPIVENAIWHGLLHSHKKEKILTMNVTQSNGSVKIEIYDNGIGREKSKELKEGSVRTSYGQNITSRRLDIINTSKDRNATFEIFDLYDESRQPSGTYVKIELPLLTI